MKLSYNWLKRYLDFPADLTMDRLSHDLTMRTVEVEGVEDLAEKYNRVIAGQILTVAPHPNADKLHVCMVDIGEEEPVQIVCGGSNLREKQWVVVTLPGAQAIWHGEGEPVIIEEVDLRGLSSYGMICGADELELGDLFPKKQAHEVIDLEAFPLELRAGEPIADLLGLNDYIIEIDNKSLTHRPDLWGHYGIARELAAIYQRELKPLPALDIHPDLPAYPVSIEDEDRCGRFMALAYDHLDDRKAPLWMQADLMKVGVKPINAIVDITNYVMLSIGQPGHAYDRDHLREGIVVRPAMEGEKLVLLDGKELVLSPANTVIADHEKAIGLAGIMGGAHDSILQSTRSIVLELASFKAQNIRKTAQEFGLRTEASSRFEKALDSQRTELALVHSHYLIKDIFPEAEETAFSDAYPRTTEEKTIEVSTAWLSTRLGKTVDRDLVDKLLSPLGFSLLDGQGDLLTIRVPSWRSTGDVEMIDDILEEVARMIGYENFELLAPKISLDRAINQKNMDLERSLREYLAFSCGFREIFSYPWLKDEYIRAAQIESDSLLTLAQPPAPDQNKLRSSLLPGLIEAAVKNLRYYDDFRIFELAQVFLPGKTSPSCPEEVLPFQERQLGACCVGSDPVDLFYTVKGLVEELPVYNQLAPFQFRHDRQPVWADPKAWLEIYSGDEKIGEFGLLSAFSKLNAGIKYQDAAIFLMNVDRLEAFDSRTNNYRPLPTYPHVVQDVSVLVDDRVNWAEVVALLEDHVQGVSFVDEYHGKRLEEGKKSITVRVELGSETGTLTNEEIEDRMKLVISQLQKLGSTLRDA